MIILELRTWEKNYQRDEMLFSLHHIRGNMVSIWLRIHGINHDYLDRVMSVKFISSKITFFFFLFSYTVVP